MARALAAGADWIGEGTIKGRLYRVGDYPGLVVDPSARPVAGDLFRIYDCAAMLMTLDAYEEIGPGFPEPQEYVRLALPIATQASAAIAWVYCYNWPVAGLPVWSTAISPPS